MHRTIRHLPLLVSFVWMTLPSAAQDFMVEPAAYVTNPTFVTQAPGDPSRLFVTSQQLGIEVIIDGVTQPQPFLDVNAEAAVNGGLHSFGLMGMAFHPGYQTNGRFYVAYMDRLMMVHVAEYRVSATDPNVADTTTRVQILGPYQKSFHSHSWNHLWFGPDGMLYIATGDDQQTASATTNDSQNIGILNGKILRLDVEAAPPYVPLDNPLVGVAGADERVFALGLRQPWRMHHDPVTDAFYIGDVGAQGREEISVVDFPSLAGANFGWRCFEGTQCTNFADGCATGCSDPGVIDPVVEYPHDNGRCAVIGGVVYRGSGSAALQGQFLYSDFCSGRFWSFEWDGTAATNHQERTEWMRACDGTPVGLTVSFGQDLAGEVYVCDWQNNTVWRIVERTAPETYCVTAPNSVGAGALMGSTGSPSMAANDLTLTAGGAPAGTFGIFFYGPEALQLPLGDGFLCVGPGSTGLLRLGPPETVDPTGNVARLFDVTQPPASSGPGEVVAGSTWHFQLWYRDPMAGGTGYNLSDGLRVTFCP